MAPLLTPPGPSVCQAHSSTDSFFEALANPLMQLKWSSLARLNLLARRVQPAALRLARSEMERLLTNMLNGGGVMVTRGRDAERSLELHTFPLVSARSAALSMSDAPQIVQLSK